MTQILEEENKYHSPKQEADHNLVVCVCLTIRFFLEQSSGLLPACCELWKHWSVFYDWRILYCLQLQGVWYTNILRVVSNHIPIA